MQSIKNIIALMDAPAAVVCANGAVLSANDALLEFLDTDQEVLNCFGLSKFMPLSSAQLPITAKLGQTHALEVQSNAARIVMSVKPVQCGSGEIVFLCQKQVETNWVDPRLEFLLDHVDQGVWEYDTTNSRFAFSHEWRKIRGLPDDLVVDPVSDEWLLDIHPSDRSALQLVFEGQARGDTDTMNIQYRLRHFSGKWIWIWCRGQVMERTADGRPLRIVGSDIDITEIKENEASFSDLNNKLQMAIEVSGIGTFEFDSETAKVYWDDRMLGMYGISDEPNIRDNFVWDQYLHPEDRDATVAHANECQAEGKDFRFDYRIIRPDGEIRYLRSIARYVQRPQGSVRMVGVNIDMTEDFQRAEQLETVRNQLEYDSRHDALTGLANRRMLDETVEYFFDSVASDDTYAVLHLDLDYFKQINDTLGHAAGDAVLVHVANELGKLLSEDELICRVGGDEFAVFFPRSPRFSELATIAENVIAIASTPYMFEDQPCNFGISVGIAVAQGAPKTRSEVFINADLALYAAKEGGRAGYRFYTQKIGTSNALRLTARQELTDALSNGELTCFYQPQFDSRTLQLIGAEALVRWDCPRRGIVSPADFLPLAEEVGLTSQIDAVVFERVCKAQDEWLKLGLPVPRVSVNVSNERLKERSLRSDIKARIQDHHLIAFELLESAFLDNLEGESLKNLNFIREAGMGIELDDFGSGRSSIVAMQNIRPDRIKIDRSLTQPIVNRPTQLLILQALSRVARLDNIGVVIEGIETEGHLATIKNVDCDVLQGFALGYPMAKTEFENLLGQQGQLEGLDIKA